MTGLSIAALGREIAKARAIQAEGDLAAARLAYDAILDQMPDEPQALCLRGLISRDEGDILAAERDFRRAIKVAPRMPLTYQLLGDLLHNAKHLVMAADVYEQGLQVDPQNIPILGNLAHTRLGLGHFEACLALSRRVTALDGRQQESWFRIGASLCQLNRFEEALAPLRRALELKPDCQRSRAAYCVALHRLGRADEVAQALAEAAPLIEQHFDYLTQFNEVLAWLHCTEIAFPLLEGYLARHPESAPAWSLLARLHIVSGDEAQGNALLQRAVDLVPDDPDLLLTLGLQLFKHGSYRQGLELYRHRWDRPDRLAREDRWDIAAPSWNGTVLSRGALMVWTEQGIGDLAMFAGFFDDLADLAPRVMIETIGRFRGLMQRSFPWADVFQRDQLPSDFIDRCDVQAQVPIGDLPLLLQADFDQLPARRGYLVPDAAATWRLRDKYQRQYPGRILVGISWRSGNKSSAMTRSAELPFWRGLLNDHRFAFISLQYGKVENEVAAFNATTGSDLLVDAEIDPLLDLDLFAAQVAAMDLVITVDNSTAHFAGALGKRVWVLLPFVADWRWLTNRNSSIWYEKAHLFRQTRPDDWSSVMAEVAKALPAFDAGTASQDLVAFMHRCASRLAHLGNSADAEVFYRRLLQIDLNDVDALYGLGRTALATGHAAASRPFLAGAARLAPERLDIGYCLERAEGVPRVMDGGLPPWLMDGNPPPHLYLWSDGILAHDLAAGAALRSLRNKVDMLTVACHPALLSLLGRSDRRLAVFPADDGAVAEIAALKPDAQTALFGLARDAAAYAEAWMLPDPVRLAEQQQLNRTIFGDRLVVGVVSCQEGRWAGVPWPDWRALDPAVLAVLAAQPDIGIVALDGLGASHWPAGVRYDPALDFRRRADTYAAAMAAVDIVVAVESAAAWLAVALGRPLFLLEARMPEPIVPAVPARRRFRQSASGSWARALTELLAALRDFER